MQWIRVVTCFALGLALSAATAPVIAQNGRITGTIIDRTAGAPIANVSVTVVGTTLGARTGADGRFAIAEVPAGSQRVRAARIGYAPTDQLATIQPGQTVTVNMSLSVVSVA